MPLTADDHIQENNNTFSGTTNISVTLGSDATVGNVVFVALHTTSILSSPGSGFLQARTQGAVLALYYKPITAAESAWTFTLGTSGSGTWYAWEMSNVDTVSPVDVSTGDTSTTLNNGSPFSTLSTTQSFGLTTVTYAMWGVVRATGGLTQSWSGYTNSFEELVDLESAGTTIPQLAVARLFKDGAPGVFESTATLATTGSGVTAYAQVVSFRSADSPIFAPLALFAGFEWGTHAGGGNTGATSMFGNSLGHGGTWGTNYLIQAGSARSSSYGLRIVQSASNGHVRMGNMSAASFASFGMNVRVVSATGTVIVALLNNSAGVESVGLLYDATNSKFGVRCATTGTTSWQSGTTATNTWVWVDIRFRNISAVSRAEWRIETGVDTYTDEAYAENAVTMTVTGVTLGNTATQTMTADYDDVCVTQLWAAYPLGPHQMRLLVPETTGATVSGTSTNFSEFTANGSLAAWASTSGQRIDEIPPTISASSDGVVQTAVAASDYMNFPMTTYTCAVDEVVAAVRALFSEWGGTGSGTGTIGYRGHDGTTERTFVAASASYDADSLTTASSTYPLWKCAMWPRNNGWTQTALDAAALRVGFSTDATPDMGISAAYLEVAIRKAPKVRTLTMGESDEFKVDLYVNPFTSATVSYLITNDDATRDVTFDYSLAGTPQTPVVVGPSANDTVQINADAFGDVSDITLTPEVL